MVHVNKTANPSLNASLGVSLLSSKTPEKIITYLLIKMTKTLILMQFPLKERMTMTHPFLELFKIKRL